MQLDIRPMHKVNITANTWWLKSVELRAAARHCSDFADIKPEISFGDHEVTLARPAATRINIERGVQQYTCTCVSTMTWIYNPYSDSFSSHPENPPQHTICRRYSIHYLIFPDFLSFSLKLYFLEITLHGFHSLWLFKPRLFLWKWIFSA